MTRNDVLAEYVRTYYPEIENSFGFACYSAGVALGSSVKSSRKHCSRRWLRLTNWRTNNVCHTKRKDR